MALGGDDQKLLEELADKLADVLERRSVSRGKSAHGKPKGTGKKNTGGSQEKERAQRLKESREQVRAGARGVVGAVSPDMAGLMDLGESLGQFVKGIKELAKASKADSQSPGKSLPDKPPSVSVPRPRPPATGQPQSGQSAAPGSVGPSIVVSMEGVKDEIAKHLEAVRQAKEVKESKREELSKQKEEERAELQKKRAKEDATKQARSDAYTGARGVVGAVSPDMAGLMDLGMNVKRMIGGIAGMRDSEGATAGSSRKAAQAPSGAIPSPSSLPSTVASSPVLQNSLPTQTGNAGRTRVDDAARTALAGPEDRDREGMDEGVLDLGEIAASEREDERTENIPEKEQREDFEVRHERRDDRPGIGGPRSIHRQPISSERSGGFIQDIFEFIRDAFT